VQDVEELIDWIIGQGLSSGTIDQIMEGLAPRLIALGYPIVRASIAMPSIDPMQKGFSVVWTRAAALSVEVQGHDDAGQEMFERSPIFDLLSKDLLYGRWRLPSPDGERFPLLNEIAELGATDYLIKLAAFPGETALGGVGLSIAIGGDQGFSAQQIAVVDRFMPALALACCRVATTRIATDVLAVYTGTRTSGRILGGQTRRGDGASIYSAILLADLKNFTSLNESWPPERIVALLNEHFEAIAGPVEDQDGEILKFMGDSLLAIFPASLDDPAEACGRALAAARTAIEANHSLNRERETIGAPQLLVDVALHVGEVFYGNVGASRRLDFTAIGRAVNEAARIEKIADLVGYSLLASAPFAANVKRGFASVGSFQLKGVAEPAEVFAWID
jgi:adenylate cyclase